MCVSGVCSSREDKLSICPPRSDLQRADMLASHAVHGRCVGRSWLTFFSTCPAARRFVCKCHNAGDDCMMEAHICRRGRWHLCDDPMMESLSRCVCCLLHATSEKKIGDDRSMTSTQSLAASEKHLSLQLFADTHPRAELLPPFPPSERSL